MILHILKGNVKDMRAYRGLLIIIVIGLYLVISPISIIAQPNNISQEINHIYENNLLLPCDYSNFIKKTESQIGLFFTLSNSNGSDAIHIHVPFLLRFIKSPGIGIFLIVWYSSEDAETIISDRSGNIVNQIEGPHMLLYHGFGMFGYNGSAFNSPVWLVGVSIMPPRILSQ